MSSPTCNNCGHAIDEQHGERAYRLVPEKHMDKARAGTYSPWCVVLCALCYGRQKR